MLVLCFSKDSFDVDFGIRDALSSYDGLEDLVSLSLTLIKNDSWAIDQIDTLSHGNVLPHFGLTWNRSNLTHLLSL